MENKNLPLGRINLLIMGLGFVIVIIGFLLMTGSGTVDQFNPDIFSTRRIVIAPIVTLLGFIIAGVGILFKPCSGKCKDKREE